MTTARDEINDIVNRETTAWNTQDVQLLLSIFHPDMVWVWPKDRHAHNPVDWETKLGRFNSARWRRVYEDMFDEYTLIHNNRKTIKIEVSKEQDGAFAVVDIDTLWRTPSGEENHWHGRTCKTYVKTETGWKMIAQTGVLEY